MSSVLSYNQFNFGPIFKHGDKAKIEKRREKHQPSFAKQMIYFILFTMLNLGFKFSTLSSLTKTLILRLTISTEITMMPKDRVKMVDINGNLHSLSKLQVRLKNLKKKTFNDIDIDI